MLFRSVVGRQGEWVAHRVPFPTIWLVSRDRFIHDIHPAISPGHDNRVGIQSLGTGMVIAEIGRASCRERVEISGVAEALNKEGCESGVYKATVTSGAEVRVR